MAGITYIVFLLYLSVVLCHKLTWKPSPVAIVTEHHGDTSEQQRQQTLGSSDYQCPGECSCQDTGVTCPPGSLHDIPGGLPANTTRLYLDSNHLTALDRDMFRSLRLLRSFSAVYNRISVIEKGTFSDLHDLVTIYLSKNPLHISAMVNFFCSLQSQSLWGIYLTGALENNVIALGNKDFDCLKGKEIKELVLEHNNFQNFPDEIFAGLRVDYFNLINTTSEAMLNTKAFLGIQYLVQLYLDGNNWRYFPRFSLNGTDILPKVSILSLDHNAFNKLTVNDMQGLSELGSLFLNNIHFAQEKFSSFGTEFYVEPQVFAAMSSLTFLQYNGNAFILNRNQNEMFRFAGFTSLDVSHLKFHAMGAGNVSFDLFRSIPDLKDLTAYSLDFSIIGWVRKEFFGNAFQRLRRLETLDLDRNGLSTLYPGMFQGCDNLKTLFLRGNLLKQLQYPAFSELLSLEVLVLSDNDIKMTGGQFSTQNLQRLSRLELSGNPFSCTCDLLGFLEFMKRHKDIFGIKVCTCAFPKALEGFPLLDSGITASECATSLPVAFFIAMAISGVSLLGLVCGSFVYRYRWHVKYMYFQMKSKYFSNGGQNDFANYAYDVFVSYHAKSLSWVKSELLPILENKLNLKVCLHDRDWLAGIDIVENIVRSVNGSRKVVLVVTNAFARSQWCQLELTMAQHSLLEKDKNNLILIMMEEIHDYNMTPRLALQMKTQTYIEWDANHVKARELFERQLEVAVRRPTTSLRQQAV